MREIMIDDDDDMRLPNKDICRERHITPTMDDIIADLNGAKWFSKLDLNAGYHQLVLLPDSRYITTFMTHLGLRQYKRLNFGISSAAEVFQNAIRETVSGLQGVLNISDHILIFSSTLTRAPQTPMRDSTIPGLTPQREMFIL
mgnify:CR=1 FL=1